MQILVRRRKNNPLLVGEAGVGKTAIAEGLAKRIVDGQVPDIISDAVVYSLDLGALLAGTKYRGDFEKRLKGLLAELKKESHAILFIDEIHRLNPAVEEILYPAMEDFQLDLIIGEGPAARSVRIDLAKFTLVGATTRQGLLTTPLRDRFGIPVRLNFYTEDELLRVVTRGAGLLGMGIDEGGAREIARRSRGTPRVAGRLMRRVRDFASVLGEAVVTSRVADDALTRLEVDGLGLDAMDRRYLTMIATTYKGGPVGVETLAAGLSEPRDTVEEVIEPYLIQLGLIARTARGRCLNDGGWLHLGLAPPSTPQGNMFDK